MRTTQVSFTSRPQRLSPEEHRNRFSSYYATVQRICSPSTAASEIEQLKRGFNLDKVISDIEHSFGVSIENNKLEISSDPPLIKGLGRNYSSRWGLILNGSSLLIALYKSRENRTNQAIDHYKAEFFKEFQSVMNHIRGVYPARTESGDIRQRLLNFSKQTGIGRERFEGRINAGRNLLGLSIWISKEYTAKMHPMPDFTEELPVKSLAQSSALEAVHKARQGLLFEEFDTNKS